MYSLACRDLGIDCDYVATAPTKEEVKLLVLTHSRAAHADLMKAMDDQQRAELSNLADTLVKAA